MLDASRWPLELPPCDAIEDITDVWQDETDSLNERGEICEAHFLDKVTRHGCRSTIIGLSVTCEMGTSRLPRELAAAILGTDAMTRLERLRAETVETNLPFQKGECQ